MTFVVADRVRDTTSTTGTGVVTVSGTAPIAYQTFSAVCSVNDTLPVTIAHQTANEWETGIYTYSASNQLTRTLVLASSNAGSLVSFSAGTKDVFLAEPGRNAYARELLAAARNYYVRTDGADTNTGLANTAGGAFLTIQRAYNVIAGTLDLGGNNVTINVAAGTYAGGLGITQPWTGGGGLTLAGSSAVISPTNNHCVSVSCPLPGILTLSGCKLQTTTSGDCVINNGSGLISGGANMEFGASAGNHMSTGAPGAYISFANITYAISGGAASYHLLSSACSKITINVSTVNITGTPAFTAAFAYATRQGFLDIEVVTFSGAATGKRYNVDMSSVIFTGAAGATYLPGNVAGTADATTYGSYN